MTGFFVVLGIGLVLLVLAALRDRQTRLRTEGAPGSVGRSPRPARRHLPSPDPATREVLDEFRAGHEPLAAALADPAFAVWDDPATAEVSDADVLCCSEPPAGIREVAASLAAARRHLRPLLLACPPLEAQALAELTHLAGERTGQLVVVTGGAEVIQAIAAAAVARTATRVDLQSGASPNFHGRVAHVVADAQGTWLAPVEA